MIKITRFLFVLMTISLLFSFSVTISAEDADVIAWKRYRTGNIQTFFSEKTDDLEKIVARALIKEENSKASENPKLYIIASDIKKATIKETDNYKKYRIFTYISFGKFSKNNDGIYEKTITQTAPYEIYAVENVKTNAISVFFALSIPPRKLAPEVWAEYDITNSNYDPSMLLKRNILETASPSIAKQAIVFIDSDKSMMKNGWVEMLEKPFENTSDAEIQTVFKNQLTDTEERYTKAVNEYNERYPNILEPIS